MKSIIIAFFSVLLLSPFLLCPQLSCAEESRAPAAVSKILEPWSGDFDGMVERRTIRVLVTYSKTFYFLDGAEQRGTTYEAFKEFEKKLNEQLKLDTMKVQIVFVPVKRDEIFPALLEGLGDIAAANLTITPEREELVDFSDPLGKNVDELIVSGPNSPQVNSLDELAGQEVFVRPSSSYYGHLVSLNERFKEQGKAEITLVPVEEFLEDEDLLEMVNAGLIPLIVVDSHKASFWAQIFENITVHSDVAVNTGGRLAWAFRKGSPKLQAKLNAFVKEHKKGTLFGNIMFTRYLQDTKWVKNAASESERRKFEAMIDLFKEYGVQYGFDPLMVAAQGYQESRLDQSVISPAGAIGVMQLLPSTATDPAVGIPNIEELEANIHAGVKYMYHIYESNFKDAEMDKINKGLFCFASYNAGPAKIKKLRQKAKERGFDPNVWFDNVERIAAEEIGRETVHYVSNIYKYYVAYKLIQRQTVLKRMGTD